MTAPATHKQSDIRRILAAVKQAGMGNAEIKFLPDGTVIISNPASPDNDDTEDTGWSDA